MRALRRRLDQLEEDSVDDRRVSSVALVRKDAWDTSHAIEAVYTSAGYFCPEAEEDDDAFLERVRATGGHNRSFEELSDQELECACDAIENVCSIFLEDEDAFAIIDLSEFQRI